ncbi:MAG: hypothetical protein KZQ76_14905, partial [Candidatus Thiodiazotropha sp. (ex Epidulcina cf. delphinae)]|nr:hypothetical protein [Candidatus Thiodiazotropha sp. (ex Epidulcina cf. delphinae)]
MKQRLMKERLMKERLMKKPLRSKSVRLMSCGVLLAPLAALVSAPPAQAFGNFLSGWMATYPASASGSAGCQLCH